VRLSAAKPIATADPNHQSHAAALEATIKPGARTDFAESSRVFLPNSRRRYGPRHVAMRKHCRLLRVAVSRKTLVRGIAMKRTLLVITTAIALAAMLPTLADAQMSGGGAASGGGGGGAAGGGGGGAAGAGAGGGGAGGGGAGGFASRGLSGGGAMVNAPQGGAMRTPSGRSGGVAMGAGPPRGSWAGRNMAGRSTGNWQGRHFARRHHGEPSSPTALPHRTATTMLGRTRTITAITAAGRSASCAERTAGYGFAIDSARE
jgi:hypothetical protein